MHFNTGFKGENMNSDVKNRLNPNLFETTHSNFRLLGRFDTSSDINNILNGSTGTLNYHDGIGELEVTPMFMVSDGMEIGGKVPLESNKQLKIYGYLEDGTYVRINIFRNSNWIQNIPGMSTSKYTIWNLDFSKTSFKENKEEYDHLIVNYDSLNELGAFIIPKKFENNKKSDAKLINRNDDFDAYLTYEFEKTGNIAKRTTSVTVELEIQVKKYSDKIMDFVKQFNNFLSILSDSKTNITGIRYLNSNNDTILLNLSSELGTSRNTDCSSLLYSELNFSNYEREVCNITSNIYDIDDKLKKLIQNYIYNIDSELNYDSALINYVNSIDIYMNGTKYQSNGHKIKGLFNKIKFWLKKFPPQLYGMLFNIDKQNSDDDKRDAFIHSLVDTRDFLTHFDKRNSEYLISDGDKLRYVVQLRVLIHMYILLGYGVPQSCIDRYYRRYILDKIS